MNLADNEAVLAKLTREVKRAGSQKAAAMALGISPQYLTDLLKKRRGPGAKLLEKLGLEVKVVRA